MSSTTPTSEPFPSESACYPVPLGHVPYTPALPHAMGPLWDAPVEWWYYVGWAMDEAGAKRFTILLETLRISQDKPASVAILYGIGCASSEDISQSPVFVASTSFGLKTGDFPFPTSRSWSNECRNEHLVFCVNVL